MTPPRRPMVRETVSLYGAKTRLSELVDRAAAGEEIVIAKSGKPRAVLVPLGDVRPFRVPGRGKGQWRLKRSSGAPLPSDLLEQFERWRITKTPSIECSSPQASVERLTIVTREVAFQAYDVELLRA